MKTRFYDRTAYSLSSEPVPNCFLKLDDHFDQLPIERQQIPTQSRSCSWPKASAVAWPTWKCTPSYWRTCANAKPSNVHEDDRAAILTRSFLLGFISAARGLLDSSAVTLATLYESAPESRLNRTFTSGDFWHQLVLHVPAVHRRYHPFRLFFNEVLRWQHETVYRLPPLVSLHAHYGHLPSRDAQLRVVDDINFDLEQLAHEPYSVNWIDPLQLYARWKPRLLALCEKICQDIETCSKKRQTPGRNARLIEPDDLDSNGLPR